MDSLVKRLATTVTWVRREGLLSVGPSFDAFGGGD